MHEVPTLHQLLNLKPPSPQKGIFQGSILENTPSGDVISGKNMNKGREKGRKGKEKEKRGIKKVK
jgi:hypothetical protein